MGHLFHSCAGDSESSPKEQLVACWAAAIPRFVCLCLSNWAVGTSDGGVVALGAPCAVESDAFVGGCFMIVGVYCALYVVNAVFLVVTMWFAFMAL